MQSHNWEAVLEAAAGDIRRLAFVVRYSSIPVSLSENVAEHQYWVAIYAALIHRELMPDNDKLLGPILLKAIIHDLAESVTGDVVRTFKYSSKKLKSAIDEAEEGIVKNFPDKVIDLYRAYTDMFGNGDKRAEDDHAYVEAVVKAADFMSLQQYMNREWLRGNREIQPFFDRMIADLDSTSGKIAGSELATKDPRIKALGELYEVMAQRAMYAKRYTA